MASDEGGQEQADTKNLSFRQKVRRVTPNILRGPFSGAQLDAASENNPSFDRSKLPSRWGEKPQKT